MRTTVFQIDGADVLVTIYDDEHMTLAVRPDGVQTWGPPLEPTVDER